MSFAVRFKHIWIPKESTLTTEHWKLWNIKITNNNPEYWINLLNDI